MRDPITGGIDPIKIEEANCRIQRRQQELLAAGRAADALLWFKEFAEGKDAANVIKGRITLVASATSHAPMAQSYIDAAVKRLLPTILSHAVTLAEDEFDKADIQ